MSVPHMVFIAGCLYWACVEGFVGLREAAGLRNAHGRAVRAAQDRGSRFFLIAGLAGGIYAGVHIAMGTDTVLAGGPDLHFLLGAAVLALGSSLRLWSVLTLGRFFRTTVVVQEGHRVVSAGPYRYVRHPSYSALMLNVLGLGLGLGSWLSLTVMLVLSGAGLVPRILVEEKVLTDSLGAEYGSYRRRTKRLIPFIY
jgi:protein-S-isoprenylcysteine O-methyltransferase Ste14